MLSPIRIQLTCSPTDLRVMNNPQSYFQNSDGTPMGAGHAHLVKDGRQDLRNESPGRHECPDARESRIGVTGCSCIPPQDPRESVRLPAVFQHLLGLIKGRR